jgi:predicted acetyltransferase
MKVELKQLSIIMGTKEYAMLQRLMSCENGFTNPACGLSYLEYKNWLVQEDRRSRGIDLPDGWVPYTTYILYIDGLPVGYGRVRHVTNQYLEHVAGVGAFGYGIAAPHRNKGYGTILFTELLKKCQDFGYRNVKFFPHRDNVASLNIMHKHGGTVIGDFNEMKVIVSLPLPQQF